MLHFFLQKSRRISHTGFLHVPRSWLEDTNPPLVGIAGSVLANYRAYRCFVSAWTAKQKRRLTTNYRGPCNTNTTYTTHTHM